ncbi:MAG: YfhO family protein [Huintestinicola sp.]
MVEDEQISRFEGITEKYDNQRCYYDHDGLKRICDEKSASACDSFVTDNKGFSAHISLDSPKPVFFSVPYSKYWSAYINGEPVQIEKVNYGFMAVICPEGESDIRFDYVNTATLYGLYISIGAIIILIVYTIAAKKISARCKDAENK